MGNVCMWPVDVRAMPMGKVCMWPVSMWPELARGGEECFSVRQILRAAAHQKWLKRLPGGRGGGSFFVRQIASTESGIWLYQI